MRLSDIPYFGPRARALLGSVKARSYRREIFDVEEGKLWERAGLDYAAAVTRLDASLAALGLKTFDVERRSIHWALAAAVEQKLVPARILELGTFDGGFTRILSQLYPHSEITTVDLPGSDPVMREMYSRREPERLEREMEKRRANLARSNISAIEINTFFLLDHVAPPFDLVWVDAGHRFPDVAWDLCNAFHLVRPGGIVMVDDVTMDPAVSGANLGPDTDITLRYIAQRIGDPIHHFLKRRNVSGYLYPEQRKYVAWCECTKR
jgi:predicted O-methyltransferase YrrM